MPKIPRRIVKVSNRTVFVFVKCGSFCTELIKIRVFFTEMDFLPYEDTVPLVKATHFDKFMFHKPEDVHELINSLPDDPYGIFPDTADPESDHERGPAGPKISPSVFGKLKPAAKALNIVDEKKACGIAKFVKETVFRDLEPIKNMDETQNCAYQAALQQISNWEYTFHSETGELYTATDFRNQVIFNLTAHADDLYPKLVDASILPTSYKAWLHNQLDPQEPGDEVAIFGIRSSSQCKYHKLLINVEVSGMKQRRFRSRSRHAVKCASFLEGTLKFLTGLDFHTFKCRRCHVRLSKFLTGLDFHTFKCQRCRARLSKFLTGLDFHTFKCQRCRARLSKFLTGLDFHMFKSQSFFQN